MDPFILVQAAKISLRDLMKSIRQELIKKRFEGKMLIRRLPTRFLKTR